MFIVAIKESNGKTTGTVFQENEIVSVDVNTAKPFPIKITTIGERKSKYSYIVNKKTITSAIQFLFDECEKEVSEDE